MRMRPQGDELMAARRQVRFAPTDHIGHLGDNSDIMGDMMGDKEEAEGQVGIECFTGHY